MTASERSAEIERACREFLEFMRANVCEDRPTEGMVELTADPMVSGELAARMTAMEEALRLEVER